MSATKMLKRQPLEGAFDYVIDENLRTLSQRVKESFGYNGLESDIRSVQEDNSVSLRQAIIDAGFKPFIPHFVGKYKNKMLRQLKRKHFWHNYNMTVLDVLGISGLIVGILALIGAAVCAGNSFTTEAHAFLIALTGLFIGLPSLARIIIMANRTSTGYNRSKIWGAWEKKPFNHTYTARVPEFALETALAIKDKCPSVKFFIDELVVRESLTHVPARVVDPFLVAFDSQGNEYYLEVWNEPKFKAFNNK